MTLTADIAALRAFNRLYTRRLGFLNARLDDSPFSLTEARVLYELAHREDPTAAELTRALDLDPAQMSRTLKRFEARGLVETFDHPNGGRSRPVRLTEAGREAFSAARRNTETAIGALLESLPETKRRSLLAAAGTISQVFEPTSEVTLRGFRTGDLGWITHRQAVLYAEEYGWTQDYEAMVAQILSDFVRTFDPEREAAWVAEVGGRIVGSVFLVRGEEPGVGRLRLLYVEPDTRGLGVGRMLVDACVERARTVGYDRLVLWTNSILTAARHLYQRAGFVLVEEAPHHSFGHDLVGQTWSLDLRA